MLVLGAAILLGGAFYACADETNRLFLVTGRYASGEPITKLIEYQVLPHSALHDGVKPPTQVAFLPESDPKVAGPKKSAPKPEIVPGVVAETQYKSANISISPYYTVAFENFNGKAKSGFGLEGCLALSKTISLVGFGETSDTQEDAWIDRLGAGVQMTGKLGKYLRPYGRFSVGYALDGSSGMRADEWFLRPEFGALIDVFHYEKTTVSLTGAWALDVDMNGKAAQRLKAGLNISF